MKGEDVMEGSYIMNGKSTEIEENKRGKREKKKKGEVY